METFIYIKYQKINMNKEELKVKDRKILQALDKDARQSIQKLARKVGVSPEVAAYRIKKLEERKIIQGYYTVMNIYKLGFWLYRVYLGLHKMSPEVRKEFLEYLTRTEQVGQIAITGGAYDMIIGIREKDNMKFQNVINEIVKKYGVYIKSKEVSIITKLWQYNKKFLYTTEKEDVHEWCIFPDETIVKVDEKDFKILSTSQGNKTSTEIERKTGITRKVVANRIKKLMKERIMLGGRVIIKRDIFGLTYFRLLFKLQSTDEKKLQSLLYFLKMNKSVTYALTCIGSWEFEAEIAVENTEAGYEFVADVKEKFEIVREILMMPIFKDLKYQFL